MDVYLVGGAVRDELLGRQVGDRDWVVVGSTPEELENLGYTRVGRDFPVYLHPQSREEYALARTERKQGRGHRGFVVDAAPEVTLEDDLQRRDLTINAIAKDSGGQLIDPYGGIDDLDAQILRHVSDAFAEDPLRVFRVARIAALLPGFSVAPETAQLMCSMAAQGDLAELSAERVWQEFDKALAAPQTIRFFEVLTASQCLADWFCEIDTMALAFRSSDALLKFAELPLDNNQFRALAGRLKAPNLYLQVAQLWLRWRHTLKDWQSCAVAELSAAFDELRVAHNLDQCQRLARLAENTYGIDAQGLLSLAKGWGAVKLDREMPKGRAYGEALRSVRHQYLLNQRKPGDLAPDSTL